MEENSKPVLQMLGIDKHFPGVHACKHVNFELDAGEVHGLLGENGAGKTTLMNILYGLHHPDGGEILLNGNPVQINTPKIARDLGIGMVHQHFMLIENLTALENVILGMPVDHPPFLDLDDARKRFLQLSEEYELDLDPSMPVWQLSVGDQQWLEILKLLYQDTKILILDEPTAVLAPAEAQRLFKTIKRLIGEGRSVIFISHKLEEMRQVAKRVTVMRDGVEVGTIPIEQATPTRLAQMMVGREVVLQRRPHHPIIGDPDLLIVENLSCKSDRDTPALHNVNLNVHGGEIVGIAGVDGNGQKELAECIAGLREKTSGNVRIKNKLVEGVMSDPSLLGYIPEDRRKMGLVLSFDVAENLVLKTYDWPQFKQRGSLNWNTIRNWSNNLIKKNDIKTPDSFVPSNNLSGGNQQKVVVARETAFDPIVLVASQPTRGLDLGAVETVHQILFRERDRGAAVVFISTELPEVLAISDRIIVMYKGEIMGEVDGDSADVNIIGEWMLGHRGETQEIREQQ